MNKRILLINPNTYKAPPAIPLGLEYAGSALQQAGWEVFLSDLCFSEDPAGDAARAVRETCPLFTGVTIRNIDTALYRNNVYFIPEIAGIVKAIKAAGSKVVIGGAGFSAAPELILKTIGADCGVKGPGERAIIRIAEEIASGGEPAGITDGWKYGVDADFTPRRPFLADYGAYTADRGIPGFATHYGCNRACGYCIEAGTPLIFRNPAAVIEELRILAAAGFNSFHLCDSEFNHDLHYAETFASRLAGAGLGINWSLYMQPAPWSERLIRVLKNSGADIITLSVDSSILNNPARGYYSYDDIRSLIELTGRYEIRVAVDLSTGLPGENSDSTVRTIEFFKRHAPAAVGVNSTFRVYPGTRLQKMTAAELSLKNHLVDFRDENGLTPYFYNHVPMQRLVEMIDGHPAFRIEGSDTASNYERLKSP